MESQTQIVITNPRDDENTLICKGILARALVKILVEVGFRDAQLGFKEQVWEKEPELDQVFQASGVLYKSRISVGVEGGKWQEKGGFEISIKHPNHSVAEMLSWDLVDLIQSETSLSVVLAGSSNVETSTKRRLQLVRNMLDSKVTITYRTPDPLE